MTPDEILALPADHLPLALYAAGLAPAYVHGLWVGQPAYHVRQGSTTHWQPHVRWDHCMPLVERYRLSLIPASRDAWLMSVVDTPSRPGHSQRCLFAEIPAMICRLALMAHAAADTPEATP